MEENQENVKIFEERDLVSMNKELKSIRKCVLQKEELIVLLEKEKTLLEREKNALKREVEYATKEKENIVLRFANQEKKFLDIKKEKETVDKLLNELKKEIKILTIKQQSLNDEKSKMIIMFDEKHNEIKRYQNENAKLKTEITNLEMTMKSKIQQEIENRLSIEKKLNEVLENGVSHSFDDKISENQKIEQEANLILLKHENTVQKELIEKLKADKKVLNGKYLEITEEFKRASQEIKQLSAEQQTCKEEHLKLQDSYSQELLKTVKLRNQLEDLQVLKAQSIIDKESIQELNSKNLLLIKQIEENENDLIELREYKSQILNSNKEMAEKIVELQNELFLKSSKLFACESENEILRKEKQYFDDKFNQITEKLNEETANKNQERGLLTKHLSEKTKLLESTKKKLDISIDDHETTKRKHIQIVKELQRELSKYKKLIEQSPDQVNKKNNTTDNISSQVTSKSDTDLKGEQKTKIYNFQEPPRESLVERILRLQKAMARQAEKIDFLENHTISLVSELQKKTKILQYYMLREQVGTLVSSRNEQYKDETSKLSSVVSAIYNGIRGNNKVMTLELSLEINRKLQAVLEDTLLKNITLKENLDVLALEIDKLTRKLSQPENNASKTSC